MILTAAVLGLQFGTFFRVSSAKLAPEIDSLFQSQDGWVGGDGAYSVVMPKGRALWLFSDTWVGKVREGKRVDVGMVNNTIGVQSQPMGPVTYTIRRSSDGKAHSFLTPDDKQGWFWLQAGAIVDGRLIQFLNQVDKAGDGGVWGFKSVGLWLGITTNPAKPPKDWQTSQRKLSNAIFSPSRTLVWGSSVLVEGSKVYVYGTDDIRTIGQLQRYLVLARANHNELADTSKWEYFDGGGWNKDIQKTYHLADHFATEHSVTKFGKGYLALYTENGLSSHVVARFAWNPWGPWTKQEVVYTCPEMGSIPNTFTYAAKAHPSLSSGDEVVFSYVVNSSEVSDVIRNSTLYWPRFVRARFVVTAL